jgi:hypothetical protein
MLTSESQTLHDARCEIDTQELARHDSPELVWQNWSGRTAEEWYFPSCRDSTSVNSLGRASPVRELPNMSSADH